MRKAFILFAMLLTSCILFGQEARNNIDFAAEEQLRHEKEKQYQFSVTYRLEAGYIQPWQHSRNTTYRDLYQHGMRLGATFDFNLPYHFSMQTGLYYDISYGQSEQHVRALSNESALPQILTHRVLSHTLMVPVRATYTQKLWRELTIWFYTGPEISVGLAQNDYIKASLSSPTEQWCKDNGWHTSPYEIYRAGELHRLNAQWGLGGGFGWAQYRLSAGYQFGLNNLTKQQNRHLWEWGWHVSFSYAF